MADIKVKTQLIDREDLARFIPLKNFRLMKFFENLASDVSSVIPEAIGQAVQGPSGGSVDDNLVIFDGTTGFKVKDSGVNIDDVAQLDSPEFTGIPKAPTAAPGTNTTQIATTAYVQGEVQDGVDGPSSATNNAVALFDGSSGKLIKDSAVPISSLATDVELQNAVTSLSSAAAAFSAHNNGVGQSIPNGTWTKLTFSTEQYDVGNKFASSAWTPPAGRPVLLVGCVALPSVASTGQQISLYKNGVEFKRGAQSVSAATSAEVYQVICMDIPNGTDVYELYVSQGTGATQSTFGGASTTYFQGSTIGS